MIQKAEAWNLEEDVRWVMDTLADTYHGRGAVELGDPFHVLIATVISQRTTEENTTAVSQRVFERFPTVDAMADADELELYGLMKGSEYREVKAPRIIEIARILKEQFNSKVPQTIEELLTLPGVGRKTANCVLIYAFQGEAICVDTHMHRITNRLGWIHTKNPDQTEATLMEVMPRDLWAGSNRLFLQHGRAICVADKPKCSKCPIKPACQYGNTPGVPKR